MQLIKLIKCMSGQIPREKFQHTNTLSCFRDSCFDVSVKRQLGIKNNPKCLCFISYHFISFKEGGPSAEAVFQGALR